MPVKFTVDHVKAAQDQADTITILFDELRRFANESTHMDDPLHPARLEAKTILDSSKYRDMPDALLSLSKALVVFQAKYEGMVGAEEGGFPKAAVGDYFTATPATISAGKTSLLKWRSSATELSIDQGIGSVQAEGQKSVSPATTTTYALTGKSADKTAEVQKVTVTVK